ncbi:bifunctional hydroxymethylpyrimidine kinase/phosphomethylpyrimidine kinase [Aciditerrimonas ferrireducens]|uniref:bifunctional hydroxymethylpyrimidine kinase/phosphomethylpyrimidine kinase n=1 Tax=Aciditerrimonas ferrireducens TaxID=667306 RepID=UPI00200341AE|nr:bifunctional hydroxymethylpyrimidine kinase/phosphomethylpyrimidine kinase [Aciditerrimonas ferrireducens]MCK4177857.1 bifunctional hydroxymethylpyrimidine kinase/phosphomethylpyrimidine kinase [Aciditerrimonas ferrireducens]
MPGNPPPVALTIAGSDSGGGAGLQADLAAFGAFGVHGTTVVTAVTAQHTRGVEGVWPLPPEAVAAQLDAVLRDLPVRAAKTGMLGDPAVVAVVAERCAAGALPRLVVDPVLVATSGDALAEDPSTLAKAIRDQLLPHATVVTPNLPEAAVLCDFLVPETLDRPADAIEAMAEAGRQLVAAGATMAVVKGGHLQGPSAPDVVVSDTQVLVLDGPRVPTSNDHGTGCTLSAAIAAGLAQGMPALAAVQRAKAYVAAALESAKDWRLGAGRGPVDHRVWG